ncbi:NADPH-dependent oxidoreductase [bacterium]|nr:NADPH-dependent oxidoreductase [bacterium]
MPGPNTVGQILGIAASTRPDSVNRLLLKHVFKLLESQGIACVSPDYAELDAPSYSDMGYQQQGMPPGPAKLVTMMGRCNAMIIAVPEYNWSYPGSLKNIVDWVSCLKPCPLAGLPILLLAASPSLQGGVKGLIHFRVPLEALGGYVYPKLFTVSDALNVMDEHAITHPRIRDGLAETVTGFLDYSRRLSGV